MTINVKDNNAPNIIFKGVVKWNGNHYYSGDEVKGSSVKIKMKEKEMWLFDDEYKFVSPYGEFTREEWVEIKPESLEVINE